MTKNSIIGSQVGVKRAMPLPHRRVVGSHAGVASVGTGPGFAHNRTGGHKPHVLGAKVLDQSDAKAQRGGAKAPPNDFTDPGSARGTLMALQSKQGQLK